MEKPPKHTNTMHVLTKKHQHTVISIKLFVIRIAHIHLQSSVKEMFVGKQTRIILA